MTVAVVRRRSAAGRWMVGIGLILVGLSTWLFLNAAGRAGVAPSGPLVAVPARVEFPAPQLQLRDLLGHPAALSDFRGHVVLVNLWATWCPPCKSEMPALQEYFDEHRSAGFTVVAINDGEAPGAVGRFVDERRLTFPIWLDPGYEATDVAFRTANLPASYVIDRSGVVQLMWIGAIDKPTLEAYVSPLIEE